MRSTNPLFRGLLTFVAISSVCLVVLTAFRIKFSDGLALTPIRERPIFYDQGTRPKSQSPKSSAPPAKHGDQQNTVQDDYYDLFLNRDNEGSSKEHQDYRLLTSLRNNMGFRNLIDAKATGYQIMNPTILELPREANSSHEFLIIARTKHTKVNIDNKTYSKARQVAFFANLTYNKLGRPLLKAGKWSKLLLEDFGDFSDPKHHCKNQPAMDKYIGPEDMKLFWTRTGEPLLIFTHQVDDETICQGQFIIDVRAALPELEQALGPDYTQRLPPIRFDGPTGLFRDPTPGIETHPKFQREKNWALAQSPFDPKMDLLLMVEPGQLYRYKSRDENVELIVSPKDQRTAIEEPYPPTAKPGKTWHGKTMTCINDAWIDDGHVHQSTPMLSLTLCNRGACEPDEQNTIMMGMVQHRLDPPFAPFSWYDRRIAVYEATAPYRMISVSKKFTYHGEADGTYSWTGSMSYYTNQTEFPPTNHGFLDDEIWLGFGIKDSAAGWMDIRARDLIADHYMCQGASAEYRYYRQGIHA
ncbi:hypothetical protein F53441_773 [Fusarium austroafricanum]|uniref:Amine oxidase n=1 Tax=Fusarium austroafricanum TaxID=2364996 RepID=A0A8H4KX29_9HYPO|nr:hypothetical protein F53441_773 [Fusarium austroafricanum]